MLAFELAGGRASGEAFIDTLTIPQRTASLGSVFTIVSHPPSTTHRQLDDDALAAAGITPGLLRCSVGLEDLDDLVADFAQSLGAAIEAAGAGGSAGGDVDQISAAAEDQPALAQPTPA
jgi:O-acetylhomoserine/O-acetylserine sulfhydrylase-like pyridoxal-dependent enzyme